MNILNRAKSFLERAIILSCYMSTPFHAIYHLFKIKIKKNAKGYAQYKGTSFTFFPRDISAIREVLKESEYAFLTTQLSSTKNPLIIDAGAHIGLFSLWVFSENPSANIISIEASPFTFKTLSENVQNAHKRGRKWQAFYGAAWGNNDFLSFMNDGESMGHKISTGGSVEVQGITLEYLVKQALLASKATYIDILKIDIEGAEESFLTAGEIFLPKIKAIAIELHPASCDTDRVMKILQRHYSKIMPQTNRRSTKPLLYCMN